MPAIHIDRLSRSLANLGGPGSEALSIDHHLPLLNGSSKPSCLKGFCMSGWKGTFKRVIPYEFLHASEPQFLPHKNVNELSQVKESPNGLVLTWQFIRVVFEVRHLANPLVLDTTTQPQPPQHPSSPSCASNPS